MKTWTIGKRITFGFAAVLIIMLALSVYIRTRVSLIQSGTDAVTKNHIPALELLADAKENAAEAKALTYKHIYATDPKSMSEIEARLAEISETNTKDYNDYAKIASPQCTALLDEARTQRDAYAKLRAQIIVASRAATNAVDSAAVYQRACTELVPVSAAYTAALNKIEDEEQKESGAAAESVLTAIHSTSLGLIVGMCAALALACLLGYLIIRNTTHILSRASSSLSAGAQQVTSAAGQVTASSQSLAEGASEQAASVEETSSSLEETASMTKRNAENAQKANDLAAQARNAAERGVNDMQTMSSAMHSIKTSSDEVAKIIKTIDEIAFQTNILALNAAVEAARAGEAGMGFAVVADEVRNLAQRSAVAAKETASKIEGAITSTAQGVQISSKVAEVLNEIVSKVRQVDELVAEVASASKEQTTGISQINAAVGQMDKVTQANAASAEECAAAAEELNAQALSMKQTVGDLAKLVSGSGVEAPVPTATLATGKNSPVTQAKFTSHRNGNGKPTALKAMAATVPTPAAKEHSRQEIPMEGDFKDF